MHQIIINLSSLTKNRIFGGYFLLILLMAIFPPAYLWSSGSRVLILGVPMAIGYWLLNALLLGLGVWALYTVERLRGEIPDDTSEHVIESTSAAMTSSVTRKS